MVFQDFHIYDFAENSVKRISEMPGADYSSWKVADLKAALKSKVGLLNVLSTYAVFWVFLPVSMTLGPQCICSCVSGFAGVR